MGLFSNKKNPCVICGEPTPRLFATEACGGKLCGDCAKKISVEDEILKEMTLEGLKEHLVYREENAKLHETFTETRRVKFEGEKMVIDDEHKLFYFTWFDGKNKPIFKFEELTGFAYVENMESKLDEFKFSAKLFTTGAEKEVHDRGRRVVYAYDREQREHNESLLELFKEEYHGIAYSKNLVNHMLGLDDKMMSERKPVKQMYLLFQFENPYWKSYKKIMLEPVIQNHDDEDRNVRRSEQFRYINYYEEKLKEVKNIADAVESIFDAE